LPQFIGELKKLKALFVNDNKLVYLPHCLSSKLFNEMDMSNNSIRGKVKSGDDHLFKYITALKTVQKNVVEDSVTSLSHLSLYNLMDNCVPFKRQDIPRTLWIHFNVMGRCIVCKRWILPDYCKIGFKYSTPMAIRLIKDQNDIIPWQFIICKIQNNCKRLA